MESGDYMSLNDEMTGLMNAVRNKYALTDKLSINDATGYINQTELYNVVDCNNLWIGNNGDSSTVNGAFRIVSRSTDLKGITGAYMVYDQREIISGKRYRLDTLVRGNMVLATIGEEKNANEKLNVQLTDSWQWLSFSFIAVSNIVIYARSKKDDWMELKNWVFSELGGG